MPQGREDVEREKQGVSYNAITTRSLIGRVHLSRYKKKKKEDDKTHLMRISESAVRHCAGVAAQADTDTNYIVIVLFLFLLM